MYRFLSLLLACTPIIAAATAPGHGPWTQSEIGGGGYVLALSEAASRPGTLYAALDVSGIARSDDHGRSWRLLGTGIEPQEGALETRDVDVDPRDAELVLAAIGSQWTQANAGLYRSADGGTSWELVERAPFAGNGPYRWCGRILARNPQDPDLILAGTAGDGLRRSRDGGLSWTRVGPTGVLATDLVWDRHDPDRAWLSAAATSFWFDGAQRSFAGGLWRTEDAGVSWTALGTPKTTEIVCDPIRPDWLWAVVEDTRVAVSHDAGTSWNPPGAGLPEVPAGAAWDGLSRDRIQAITTTDDAILAVSAGHLDLYRHPAGTAGDWTRLPAPEVVEAAYGRPWFRDPGWAGSATSSLHVSAAGSRWWFTDWFGVYHSTDEGRTWTLGVDGLDNTCAHGITVDPTDPRIVHLGLADQGYLRSTDGGVSFQRAKGDITNNIKTIETTASDSSRVYALGTAHWHWDSNQVFRSDDSGASWHRPAMAGLPDMHHHRCNSLAVDPEDGARIHLAVSGENRPGAGGLWRSDDGGDQWHWDGAGLPSGTSVFASQMWGIGREIARSADGSMIVISHGLNQVWQRSDDAATWSASAGPWSTPPIDCLADPRTPGRFWLVADGVYRSDDAGLSWQRLLDFAGPRIPKGRTARLAISHYQPQHVAVGSPDRIFLSRDDGSSWAAYGQDLPHRLGNLVAFSDQRLLAATNGNGVFWRPLSE